MADTISKVYLEWSEIHELVNILCKKIITEYPTIDSVMGLPRGGMIPAVLISHELNLPFVLHPGKNTLVVDDINDTGATFSWIKNDWESRHKDPDKWKRIWGNNVKFATLTENFASKFNEVSYHCDEVNKAEEDVWLVYPWENVGSYDD